MQHRTWKQLIQDATWSWFIQRQKKVRDEEEKMLIPYLWAFSNIIYLYQLTSPELS